MLYHRTLALSPLLLLSLLTCNRTGVLWHVVWQVFIRGDEGISTRCGETAEKFHAELSEDYSPALCQGKLGELQKGLRGGSEGN